MDPRQLFAALVSDEANETSENTDISVFLRLRPQNLPLSSDLFKIVDNSVYVHNVEDAAIPNKDITEKEFSFSKIFDKQTSQKLVYDFSVYPSIKDVLNTTGATFATYGTSGSGKTYTVIGCPGAPGVIPRAIGQLFDQFKGCVETSPLIKTDFKTGREISLSKLEVDCENFVLQNILKENECTKLYQEMLRDIEEEHNFEPIESEDLKSVFFYVSFIEIYKENVKDLLAPDDTICSLKVISNSGESFVQNATWVFVATPLDCLTVLDYGLRRAHFGSTNVNENSSRSHMVFTINAVMLYKNEEVQRTVFKFCDLAGSERTKKTQAIGTRLNEAKKINLSLTTLGRCLQIIHANQNSGVALGVVPVRESKLTLLLQSALLGFEKFTMIVNLQPSLEYFEENMNVLNFSAIAKNIIVKKVEIRKPTKRRSTMAETLRGIPLLRDSKAFEDILDENELLRAENDNLKHQLIAQEIKLRNDLYESYSKVGQDKQTFYEELIKRTKQRLNEQHQKRVQSLKLWQEEEIQEYEDEIEKLKKKIKNLKAKYGEAESDTEEDSENSENSSCCDEDFVEASEVHEISDDES